MTDSLATLTTIDTLINATMYTLAASSQRVYRQTYELWVDWCSNAALDPEKVSLLNPSQSP